MSVSSTDNQVIYTGSGTTGPFDFDYRVYSSSDLLVQKFEIATEVTTDLTETTDYSVSIDEDGTGSVTTVAAVTSSYKLIITRELPLTQEIEYVEADKFPATTHEEGLDRGVMIAQQLQEQLDRCVKVQAGSTTDPDELIDTLVNSVADAEAAQAAAEVAQTAAEAAATAAQAYVPSLTGNAEKVLAVKADETGTEWVEQSGGGGGASAVELSFDNGDLSAGILTVTHSEGLSAGYTALVQIVDNNNKVIIPDEVYDFAANSFKVDLTSFGTLTGTWYCTYIVKG